MNTVEIPEKSIKLEIPSHWDEMSDSQRRYCLKQAVWASLGIIGVQEAKVRCLYHLMDIERDSRSVMWDRIRSEAQVSDKYSRIFLLCEELVTFLFAANEKGELEINYDTVYNHFPELRASKVTLYGPAHLCADLTFGEFRAAIEYMESSFQSRDDMDICRMIACLYRPERQDYDMVAHSESWDGQRKQPFNRALVPVNAGLVAKIGTVYRTAVLLWFSYVVKYIQTEDLQIGGVTVNFSPLFGGKRKAMDDDAPRSGSGYGWISVLNAIAKEGPYGDMDKTEKAGLFDVLLYMLEMHEQNEKLKQKSKKK
ncbi:hypothetical protein C943_03304 [Mariniradius saccharolyticus AK6]|uniref:Uncharacterized protein n=1 Tax=Mariniradius saccharolyticus AK6 TaxID=1239962 RepID=M7Y1J7_9BACT|nr:hypothetical protein [Mariniradius saccharolyticus]EMS34617.1 hypothetical protein C943_03304 [Mariniradius saccharolyticus AK6]